MRNLVIIGLMLAGASMAGWFTVNREGDRTTIEINRSEIRDDAQRALDRGRELLDKGENAPLERVWDDAQVYREDASQWLQSEISQRAQAIPQAQVAQQPNWQAPPAAQTDAYNQYVPSVDPSRFAPNQGQQVVNPRYQP